MKLKKSMAVFLALTMLTSSAAVAANAASSEESVSAGSYYNASYLEDYAQKAYNEKNLGCTYSAKKTVWKVWSPEAASVKLNLYRTGSDDEFGASNLGSYGMTKNSSTGVWSITLEGDYKNIYYTYSVDANGSVSEVQDIYSTAVGVNGNRSMVADFASTNPDGWENDNHVLFDSASEAAVWEVHVRDFSASSTSGISAQNKGKYLAFTEGGTKLNSSTDPNAISTGIDYLVEQGINCVQLLPVHDIAELDERYPSSSSNRSWGYMPKNFSVPEGTYATDAFDGNVRIKEFKQMVQALHDRGIAVVMDVVYTHTDGGASSFGKTVPGYYYRQWSATEYSNGSGCGNETATDKLMFRKYMIDSLKHWISEYHIDGFRFDLMGIADIPTMNEIRSEIDKMYADGSGKKIMLYGEPWTAASIPISNNVTQSKAQQINARVGMFNDTYRNAIKGDTDGTGTGFVQGNTSYTNDVVNGIKGQNYSYLAPSQIVSYTDCHDNLILWDKILKSGGSSSWNTTSQTYLNRVKSAFTLVLTSQGMAFSAGASEFCRTKSGNGNSYDAGDSINCIDWSRLATYSEVAEYYKGLLQIRSNYTPLKDTSFHTPSFQSSSGNVVAYTYSNNKSNEWGNLCVIVNSGSSSRTVNLNSSGWIVVANGTKAGLSSLGTVSGNSYTVAANSSVILVSSSTFGRLNAATALGNLTVNHVDENGNVLKTETAKYKAGNTYRATPDNTLLKSYQYVKAQGNVSGKVEAGKSYTVNLIYKKADVQQYTVSVRYVTDNGSTLSSASKTFNAGDSYQLTPKMIAGYQLDTDQYPADTYGTVNENKTIKFVYKSIGTSSVKVHYYNANNWADVRCYAYDSNLNALNGSWDYAGLMTHDGGNWYSCTINAPSAYVMFHPSSGSAQEPGAGEQGYLAAGEVWIQNRELTFSSKVITSHIDLATGKKIANDVILDKPSVTSTQTYTTSSLKEREGEIIYTYGSSNGYFQPGVINVVYLYTGEKIPYPTTKLLIGDANMDGKIDVRDASEIQRYLAEFITFTDKQMKAADCYSNGVVEIKDVTVLQKYIAEFEGREADDRTGTYYDYSEPATEEPTTEEPTDPPVEYYTVTFSNALRWSGKIYCYCWENGKDGEVSWPGAEMSYLTTNDYGENQYTCKVPSNADWVIFTNGSAQTIDIPFDGTIVNFYTKSETDGLGHYQYGTW